MGRFQLGSDLRVFVLLSLHFKAPVLALPILRPFESSPASSSLRVKKSKTQGCDKMNKKIAHVSIAALAQASLSCPCSCMLPCLIMNCCSCHMRSSFSGVGFGSTFPLRWLYVLLLLHAVWNWFWFDVYVAIDCPHYYVAIDLRHDSSSTSTLNFVLSEVCFLFVCL